ncbi:MAG TPA: adenylate/guanylate cyclase domain-containing protein [Candidatus Sulfotelmatobacter sp.]|nr:adenylate/guanylate cyclase domain-containing protein [Candidatus Sulfotelmatobacter sp.]
MGILFGLIALAALGAAAGCWAVWRRWTASQHELARVRATFSRYVAPSVVDMLLERNDERLFTGRSTRATVLVCRIRNFAHFIEQLNPEETLRYVNEFYGLTGTAIHRHRGIIETFLGDGIVAVFGAPIENPTQEDDALRAALDIVRYVVGMRDRWARQGRRPFTVGIGVNTGNVIAGDTGFRDRREYAVVGTEATFAHRLQEAAYDLNAFIVASRATCTSLTDEYKLVPVSGIPLPGVRRLLDAFVVRGRRNGPERFTVPVDALIETTIQPDEPAAPVPPPAVVTAPAAVAGAPASSPLPPPPPAVRPAPEPPIARPRPRPADATPPFPELRHSWLLGNDDAAGPILPEPPPPKATYEDRRGTIDL